MSENYRFEDKLVPQMTVNINTPMPTPYIHTNVIDTSVTSGNIMPNM